MENCRGLTEDETAPPKLENVKLVAAVAVTTTGAPEMNLPAAHPALLTGLTLTLPLVVPLSTLVVSGKHGTKRALRVAAAAGMENESSGAEKVDAPDQA